MCDRVCEGVDTLRSGKLSIDVKYNVGRGRLTTVRSSLVTCSYGIFLFMFPHPTALIRRSTQTSTRTCVCESEVVGESQNCQEYFIVDVSKMLHRNLKPFSLIASGLMMCMYFSCLGLVCAEANLYTAMCCARSVRAAARYLLFCCHPTPQPLSTPINVVLALRSSWSADDIFPHLPYLFRVNVF